MAEAASGLKLAFLLIPQPARLSDVPFRNREVAYPVNLQDAKPVWRVN